MKKFLKWTGLLLVALIAGLVIAVFSRQNLTFEAEYPNITASSDSSIIARGEYLVYGPAHCSGCHSPLEYQERLAKGEKLPFEAAKPLSTSAH